MSARCTNILWTHLDDPTDYVMILRGLRVHIRDLSDRPPKANYFVAVASGTPQMHACWLLLVASGEIPAHILNVRPLRFVSTDRLLLDVRVIAATNQDLGKAIRQGQFREDLYCRLNIGEIRLPSLRERRSDIPKIALHILDADDLIVAEPITYEDPLAALPQPHEGFSLEEYLASARKQLLLRALETTRGNQSEAARLLGITPQAVHKFLRKAEGRLSRG